MCSVISESERFSAASSKAANVALTLSSSDNSEILSKFFLTWLTTFAEVPKVIGKCLGLYYRR